MKKLRSFIYCCVLEASKLLLRISISINSGRLTYKVNRGIKLRSLWGVTPIITLPILARCDNQLGIDSKTLVFTTYYTAKKFDINLTRIQNMIVEYAPELYGPLCRILLAYLLFRFDIFNLFCDRGVLAPLTRMEITIEELMAYKKANKLLFTYAYGADVRTKNKTLDIGSINLCAECPSHGIYCQCDDELGKKNTQNIKDYATKVIAMGDMVNYCDGCIDMPYWPIDLESIKAKYRDYEPGESLIIGHAPNHDFFKGTTYLRKAVERLSGEGFDVSLLYLSNVSNEEVLSLYEKCHVVVDQLVSGFHGYATVEAMALGKPVICYINSISDQAYLKEIPVINASPSTIYDVLKSTLMGDVNLRQIATKSRHYVEDYYSMTSISARLASMYDESIRSFMEKSSS